MLGAFDRDNWYEIWAVLRSNKLRTALTAFGVAWGIFMLVVMLGFGSAMQAGTQRNMKGRATNLLFVWGQSTTEGYGGMKPGRQIRFSAVYFQVVGLFKTLRSGREGERDASTIFVPFTTLKTAFKQGDNVGFFAMTAKPGTDGPELERQVREELSKAHNIAPTDKLA